jgi:hypothetical protein
MSTQAQEAYNTWKGQHKVNLQVKTDEQMFLIGFEEGQKNNDELVHLILDMEKEIKRLEKELKNAKKV